MKNKKVLFTVITIAVAVPAFLSARVIWPMHEGGPEPTAGQMPFLIGMTALESIALGIGIAFLILSWKKFANSRILSKPLATLTYLAIGWSLVSWWPHDNLHIYWGESFPELIYLEYGFHATLMVGAVIIMVAVNKLLTKPDSPALDNE